MLQLITSYTEIFSNLCWKIAKLKVTFEAFSVITKVCTLLKTITQRYYLVPRNFTLLLVQSIPQKNIILVILTVLHQVKSMSSNNNLRKIFLLVCIVLIIQYVYHVMNKYGYAQWWEKYLSISSPNILVHDVINLLHYKHWTDKRK